MGKRYLIVGAGINGLTIADKLSKDNDVIIVEKNNTYGGLAQTFTYNEFKFDSGPHWIYINNEKQYEYINGLLGEKLYSDVLRPGVFFLNNYYKWPLTIDVITKLPFKVMLGALIDMFRIAFKKKKIINNYEELTLAKFGKTLYELDFEPYTRKFTKTSLSELHTDWSKIGINRSVDEKPILGSLFSIVIKTLTPKKKQIGYYLNDGIIGFADAQVERIQKNGGLLYLNSNIEKINILNHKIQSVVLSGLGEQSFDHIIWTGNPATLSALTMDKHPPLHYITNVFYNVMLKGEAPSEYQWLYFVEDHIIFNRIYNTVKFSTKHAPKGYYGYCVEVTCRSGDEIEQNPGLYIDQVIENLLETRAIRNKNEIIDIKTEVMKEAYPLYSLNYRSEISDCLNEIYEKCSNLSVTGRTGLFWYNNMDHTIENALDEVDSILHGTRQKLRIVK